MDDFPRGFQFPSNGKAYHKTEDLDVLKQQLKVSIPFKRESVSQANSFLRSFPRLSQVSIPFKRESVSQDESIKAAFESDENVSIPFKRESVSQVLLRPRWTLMPWEGFNSLQTGKRITRRIKHHQPSLLAIRFQFPSNGKAYHKSIF